MGRARRSAVRDAARVTACSLLARVRVRAERPLVRPRAWAAGHLELEHHLLWIREKCSHLVRHRRVVIHNAVRRVLLLLLLLLLRRRQRRCGVCSCGCAVCCVLSLRCLSHLLVVIVEQERWWWTRSECGICNLLLQLLLRLLLFRWRQNISCPSSKVVDGTSVCTRGEQHGNHAGAPWRTTRRGAVQCRCAVHWTRHRGISAVREQVCHCQRRACRGCRHERRAQRAVRLPRKGVDVHALHLHGEAHGSRVIVGGGVNRRERTRRLELLAVDVDDFLSSRDEVVVRVAR